MEQMSSEWSASALIRECRLPPVEISRYLRLSAPAYARCVTRDRFTGGHRAKLRRLAMVLDRAQRVLGDHAQASHWLITANRALAFSAPIGLMETASGTQRVYAVLLRIEDGRFA